jgi:uncharacterized membrane protein
MDETERARDLERFITFLDAIVAIAVTLLVLPLVELTSELASAEEPIGDLLDEHQAQLWAFLLSFVVIARLWWSQHRAVRSLVQLNVGLFWLLMLWALTIVFLPFPTALVAERSDEAWTKILYIGTTALSMLVLAVVAALAERIPRLTDGTPGSGSRSLLLNAALLALALAITLVFPATSYFPMLLLAVDNLLGRVLRLGPGKA